MQFDISRFLFIVLPLGAAVLLDAQDREEFTILRKEHYVRDEFRLPNSLCGQQVKCANFTALRTKTACHCACESAGQLSKGTFDFHDRSWSCVSDKKLRLQEG